jgi:hypothetical protein
MKGGPPSCSIARPDYGAGVGASDGTDDVGLRAWLYRRSEAGNRRVLFLLALIGRAWRTAVRAC